MIKSCIVLLTALTLCACSSTPKLEARDNNKPAEYVYVFSNGIDPEPELIAANVNYYCKKTSYSSTGLKKACYVEKPTNPVDKILVDSVTLVGKVFIVLLVSFLGSGYHN